MDINDIVDPNLLITKCDLVSLVLDTTACGIFAVNSNGVIFMWNKSAEKITGYKKEETLGTPLNTFLRTDMNFDLFKEIKNVKGTIFSKTGKPIIIMRNASPLKDDKGNILGMLESIADISELEKAKIKIDLLQERLKKEYKLHRLIGRSRQMQELFHLIEKVAPTDTIVLLQGESGTGKELTAEAIHKQSLRKDEPFIKVNCAALADTLLESELFGHVKGAFTGAVSNKIGRFEAADGGTILLDEIAEISQLTQVKLLRVLQEQEIERVGESRPRKINVRIIAASNKNLEDEVKTGKFREDLYFRLKVITIKLPSLRKRKEDIPILVDSFIKHYNKTFKKNIKEMNKKALSALLDYQWPGNVRELKHAIEYAFAVGEAEQISLFDLPEELRRVKLKHTSKFIKHSSSKKLSINKGFLKKILEENNWNQSKTARLIGISRTTLWKKINEYSLVKPK